MKALVTLLVGFAFTLWLATLRYPGGTWFDGRSPGFSFWGNFWCDLLHERAFNHASNAQGMWLSRIAFWLFAAALFRFWPIAAALSPHPGIRRWVSALGLSGALLLLLVTVFSSATDPLLHGVFVVGSALLGVIAAGVLSAALYREADWLTRAISFALLASAGVSLGQYASQGFGADAAEWLAGAQKLTTLALFAFILRCLSLLHERGAALLPLPNERR